MKLADIKENSYYEYVFLKRDNFGMHIVKDYKDSRGMQLVNCADCKETIARHLHEGDFLVILSRSLRFKAKNIEALIRRFEEAFKFKGSTFTPIEDHKRAIAVKPSPEWLTTLFRRSLFVNLLRFGTCYTGQEDFFEKTHSFLKTNDRHHFSKTQNYLKYCLTEKRIAHASEVPQPVKNVKEPDDYLLIEHCIYY